VNKWRGMKARITLARLHRLLHYDPSTGIFTWRVDRNNRVRAGAAAGTNRAGYIFLTIDRGMYSAARLAWMYMTGDEPVGDVGFANGVATDLKWANLHAIDASLLKLAKQDWALSAATGYLEDNGKFRAHVWADSKSQYLGMFPTADEARDAYWFAKLLIRAAVVG
jgi:hypothetical protein